MLWHPVSVTEQKLEFRNVSFGYRRSLLFDNFSWSVGSGVTALMGPNGAGKTTLMSLATGLLSPRSGQVSCTGGITGQRSASLLPQRFRFVGSMRVEEAVGHSAWCAGIEKRRIPELVSQSLGSVDLAERGRDRVNQLSGGMRQRLGIACTLATEPSFLLMDEPTVGLDPLQRRGLRDLLTSLSAVTPILLSTHHVDDVCSLADVVAILKGGRLLYEGGLDDLIFDVDGPGTVARLETAYVDKVSRE